MHKHKKVTVLSAWILLTYAYLAYAGEESNAKKLSVILSQIEVVPENSNPVLVKLKRTQLFFDDVIKGDILNLNEDDFGLSFVIIQKSVEELKKEQAYISENVKINDSPKLQEKKEEILSSLAALRKIEKDTESCMLLKGDDALKGYFALYALVVQSLIELDTNYDKHEGVAKLEKIRDKLLTDISNYRSDASRQSPEANLALNVYPQYIQKLETAIKEIKEGMPKGKGVFKQQGKIE